MERDKDNNINFFFRLVILIMSMFLAALILRGWSKLSKKEKKNIIKYSIYVYILFAIIGIVFYILSYFE